MVYDKYIDTLKNLSSDIDQELTFATDLDNLCSTVDTIIICNGDKAYDYSKIPTNINVIDPWRAL